MRNDREQTVEEFWALELDSADQALLDDAFERDRELRGETAAMFGRLGEHDLRDTFVQALARRLRGLASSQRPVRAA